MNIKDKVVIITGASSGIGEATTKLLSKKGAKVVLASRSTTKLKELSKNLPKTSRPKAMRPPQIDSECDSPTPSVLREAACEIT